MLRRRGVALGIVLALLVAACGGDGGEEQGAGQDDGDQVGFGAVELLQPSEETRGPLGEEPADSQSITLSEEDIAALQALDADGDGLEAAILWPASFQFYKVAGNGIVSELEKVGAEVIATTDSGYDPAIQANDVETVLASEPELIFTWLVDPVQGAEAFRPAVDSGVSVAFMSNLPDGFQHPADYSSVVTDDLYRMGEAAAEMMAEALGGEGQIGWIFHDANAYVTNQRDQAFKAVIEERYPDIEIVAEGGFAEPQQTFDITNSMLLQHPDIDGIYAPWAVPAASVVEALRAEGRDDVKVVTLDLDPTVAVDMAEGGNIVGIVADVPYEIGRAMGAAALLKLLGKESPPFAIVPTMKVTRENLVTAWRESLKEDPPPEVLEALEG
ncbi:MAG: substrate-binding domain-containing protein [Actinomycetota bacterium]